MGKTCLLCVLNVEIWVPRSHRHFFTSVTLRLLLLTGVQNNANPCTFKVELEEGVEYSLAD